jgi:hypothetical protein
MATKLPSSRRKLDGPVGGRNIQHIPFNMENAPVAFATSGALEAYVNEVRFRDLPEHILC